MKVKTQFGLIIGFTMALSGCTGGPREIGGASGLAVVDTGVLPAPESSDFLGVGLPAVLGPSDLLQISVVGVDFLKDKQIRVDASGEISLPLAGAVRVAGLSPRDLEAVLRERLIMNGQMVDPMVSVNVSEVVSQAITIEGQVRSPGIYPVTRQLTLLQAVALARGTTNDSDLDDVVIFRTVGENRYAALYDLEQIRRGAYPDAAIYPNDIIMVGDERGRRLFENILTTIQSITTPLVLIDRVAR